MILHNAMEYACATGVLSENPLTHIRWTRQRTTNEVDPRVVINADPAHRFLTTVEADGERGRHLKALLRLHVILRPPPRGSHRAAPLEHHSPHRVRTVGKDAAHWCSTPSGSSWTNTGEIRERVPLKHRADGEVRRVPIHPELVQILRAHIDEYGPTDPDGRLFIGAHAGPITDRTYLRVFRARAKAFTAAEAASPR
jgi:integrase